MAEFFFGSWPDGFGALLIQTVLILAGAMAGVRAIDDVRAWRASRARDDVPPR